MSAGHFLTSIIFCLVSIEDDDDTNNVAEANSTIKKRQLTNKKATQSSIEVSIEEDDDANNVAEANSTIKKRQLTNKKATQSSIEVSIEEDDDTNNVAEANSTIKKRQLTNKKATQSSIEISIEEDDDTNNVAEANSTIKKRQLTNKKATQSSSKKKGLKRFTLNYYFQYKKIINIMIHMQSSSKIFRRLPLFTSLVLVTPPPGSILNKTKLSCVIVVTCPNIEYGREVEGYSGVFNFLNKDIRRVKRTDNAVKLFNLLNYFCP